jgi:hypothetical protein
MTRMSVFTFNMVDAEDGEEISLFCVAPESSDPDEVLHGDAALCETGNPENARRIADLWNKFGGN